MNPKPNLAPAHSIQTVAAAATATVIAMAILSSITFLSERDGKPLQRLAAAERACAHHSYLSDRQSCMNHWLAASHAGTVAKR